jgi:hypothetical protein
VRSVERLLGRGDPAGDAAPLLRDEQQLQDRRGVEDDHRRLRSARTASAGAGRGRVGARPGSGARASGAARRGRCGSGPSACTEHRRMQIACRECDLDGPDPLPAETQLATT